ncbi:MAG: winged helix-turn-helix transcriptional regulator, partial [Methanobacteriota archaeon]
NNTFTGGSTGVQLLNSSSIVDSNTFAGVGVAVICRASGSNLTNNVIGATSAGIVCDGGAPRIEGNDVRVVSGEALVLSNLDRAIVRGNDLHGGTLRVVGSHLLELAAVDSAVILQDSTVDRLTLDAASRLEIRWTVRIRAVEPGGAALAGATVIVHDSPGSLVFVGATGANGFTTPALLTTEVRGGGSVETRNPFTFEVSTQGGRAAVTMMITSQTDVVVAVPAPNPWPMIVLVSAAMTLTASLGAAFATERSRFALLSLLIPLYTRLSKDKVLESYNRGRVYQYVALNPGAHFNGILAALDMNNGLLVYHLEVLHREGLLRSRSEGMYRRFYTTDTVPPPILENGTTEAQLRVLKAIQEMPGITQKELSRFLGLRQSTLAYQIDRLTAMGYVAAEKQGRKVHYSSRKDGT